MPVNNMQYGGSILEAFLPKKQQTSTVNTTQTDQTQVSAEGMNAIVRAMMEGDSGLASLMTRQAGGGMYNSSTAQLLANDLATRVSGSAAVASAPKVSSTTQQTQTPSNQIDPRWLLGLQLVGELFGGGNSSSGSSVQGGGDRPGRIDITGMLQGAGDWFSNLWGNEEDKKDNQDNFGDLGFTTDNFSDFSLGGYSPDYGTALGSGYGTSGGDSYLVNGGSDWLLGSPSSGGNYGSSYDPTTWSAGINYSNDYLGGSVGWTF